MKDSGHLSPTIFATLGIDLSLCLSALDPHVIVEVFVVHLLLRLPCVGVVSAALWWFDKVLKVLSLPCGV